MLSSDLWSVFHNETPWILQPKLFQGLKHIAAWTILSAKTRPVQRARPPSSPLPWQADGQFRCLPLQRPAIKVYRRERDVSGDLEEEGVILETSVRRLHSGENSGHGNARSALIIANIVLKILDELSFSFCQTWMSSLKVQYLEKKRS